MAKPPGMCYCCIIHDAISLRDLHKKDRTSLCRCGNCKKFTGGNYGATTKLPRSAFTITRARDQVRVHEADNGSDVKLHRGFWGTRDGPLLEDGVRLWGCLASRQSTKGQGTEDWLT